MTQRIKIFLDNPSGFGNVFADRRHNADDEKQIKNPKMKTTETYINKKTKTVLRIHNDAGFAELREYKSNLFPQVIWDLSKAKEILKSWKSDAATKEQLIQRSKKLDASAATIRQEKGLGTKAWNHNSLVALRIGKADQLECDARFYWSLAQII
jgi:hypothetical protein